MLYLAPYEGSRLCVAEAYANLVAVGATPLAVTDCLNFGNPEKPEIMWQFAESVRGLADACRGLGTPIVSGNVSFYNETDGIAIKPTPMIAMVGLLDDVTRHATSGFAGAGDAIAVIGASRITGGWKVPDRIAGLCAGYLARLELSTLPAFRAVLEPVRGGAVRVAATSATEDRCRPPGAIRRRRRRGRARQRAGRIDELLFGEGPARRVVAARGAHRRAAPAAGETAPRCDRWPHRRQRAVDRDRRQRCRFDPLRLRHRQPGCGFSTLLAESATRPLVRRCRD
jgi:phosphoribosylformylglycinamidine synthase